MTRLLIYLVALLQIAGCSHHWQTPDDVPTRTYDAPTIRASDSVGRLRLLAVAPLKLETYRNTSEDSALDREVKARKFERETARYLIEKKGYEVSLLTDAPNQWNGHFSTLWEKSLDEGNLASLMKAIGDAYQVDGVLVIHAIEREPWDAFDGIMNIALMNGPLVYRITSPNIRVSIYETSHGQLVWREGKSTFHENHGRLLVTPLDTVELLRDLDNAIPPHLID